MRAVPGETTASQTGAVVTYFHINKSWENFAEDTVTMNLKINLLYYSGILPMIKIPGFPKVDFYDIRCLIQW